MNKLNIAIMGYGNVGRAAMESAEASPDMHLKGFIRRKAGEALHGYPVVDSVDALLPLDGVLICAPSREVPAAAEQLLRRGISTVDSFDEHKRIPEIRARLDAAAKEGGAVAVMSAGWDPGLDSVMRALFLAAAPRGITYTNFGPGLSLGHSVAVRAIAGVSDALSITIPTGSGIHRRMVYVSINEGADFSAVKAAIHADPYFSSDETHIALVDDVEPYRDTGHGVSLTRKGASGHTDNQRFSFDMSINNPALTAQLMLVSLRASRRQTPGCYTMIDLPPVDLLPGDREDWLHLV